MSKLEFQQENHSYTLDKKPVISVTQAIKLIIGDKYEAVDEEVLKRAAEYGTKVHSVLEELEKGIVPDFLCLTEKQIETVEDYQRIKTFKTIHTEHLVHYKDIYAGTVDGIGENIIYDIKTTSTVDYLYLALQLSLYLLAYDEENYSNYKGYCLHFPKKSRAKKILIELLSKEEVLEVVEKIKEYNELQRGVQKNDK